MLKKMIISYALSVSIYFISRCVLQIFTDKVFENGFPGWFFVYLFNFIFYIMTISCGSLVSVFFHEKIIFHSSLVAALGIVLCTFITKPKINDYELFFLGILMGAILGGIGGGLVLLIRWVRSKKTTNRFT